MGVMVPGVMGTNVVGKASRVDGIAIFLRWHEGGENVSSFDIEARPLEL